MVDIQILEKQEKTLNELWGENQVVLCLRNAKQIMKAFKESNMKDSYDTLIFNFYDWEYRKAGKIIAKKDDGFFGHLIYLISVPEKDKPIWQYGSELELKK